LFKKNFLGDVELCLNRKCCHLGSKLQSRTADQFIQPNTATTKDTYQIKSTQILLFHSFFGLLLVAC